MIHHAVLFTWKPGARPAELDEWATRLRALPDRIGPLQSLVVGDDRLHGDNSWDTAVVAVVDDLAGLQEYVQDAEHQAIIRISAPYIERFAQVDFEA